MRAGRLRHRVVFEKQVETMVDAHGQVAGAWQEVATVWASVEGRRLNVTYENDLLHEVVRTRIVVRYQEKLRDPRLRIRWGERYFRIEGARDMEGRKRELTIDVEEVEGEALTWH